MAKNFKTISVLSALMLSLLIGVNNSSAATLAATLKGRILLQVEQNGEAWYVNPVNELRYYLGRPNDAFNIMRELGLGISNKDFDSFNGYAPSRLLGRILLKVADSGKAYYVNTTDLKMYYLGRPADAFNVMRELGLGITDKNLSLISVASTSNLTRLEEFGIEIEFFEGYDTTSAGGRTVILFGPLGGNLGPVPTNEKSHIYELTAIEKRTANEIIAQVNKDGGGLITVKPEIININNITVVKWAEGGLCENRSMEVVGTKKNYLLSSLGCHKDQKFDFDYFEKTIETIKFTDSANATADWKTYQSGVLGLSIKYPNDGSYTIETPKTDQVTITQEHPGNRIHIRITDSDSVEGAYFTLDKIINNQTFRKFNYEGMGSGYGYMIKHNGKNYVFESVYGSTNDIFELMMTSLRFE